MQSVPRPDWTLAERIDPPVDLKRDHIEFGVETQRGCAFKCEFCTYRTLARRTMLDPDVAADTICATEVSPQGFIYLTDATATTPHSRRDQILNNLIARGGPPHPMWAYARVSDINEQRARLMQRAGIRHVFIGQESGDQRMLNAMKKGTRVDQIKPAISALGNHQILASFAFICGFPGETQQSVAATRALITSLNEGFESRPVALMYLMFPFQLLDFATVKKDETLRGVEHHFGYEQGDISAVRAAEEVLATCIAVSRVPHAPAYMLFPKSAGTTNGMAVFTSPHRFDMFRWWKVVERGIAIFLERDLDGCSPHESELQRIREEIKSRHPQVSYWQSLANKTRAHIRARLYHRLSTEWAAESERGPGALTRALLLFAALRDTGSVRAACSSCLAGTYESSDSNGDKSVLASDFVPVDQMAGDLVSGALSSKKSIKS